MKLACKGNGGGLKGMLRAEPGGLDPVGVGKSFRRGVCIRLGVRGGQSKPVRGRVANPYSHFISHHNVTRFHFS